MRAIVLIQICQLNLVQTHSQGEISNSTELVHIHKNADQAEAGRSREHRFYIQKQQGSQGIFHSRTYLKKTLS